MKEEMMIKKILVLIVFLWPLILQAQELNTKRVALPDSFFEKPSPSDPAWDQATEASIILFPQNITTPGILQTTVNQLKVKSLHNGRQMAVRLEWNDISSDLYVDTDRATDACAIQLAVGDFSKTTPFMGDREHAVEIIHWKALWQRDLEKGAQKVTDLYPNTWFDTYRFGKEIAIEAGNPVSNQNRTTPVEQLMAVGFGTLTTQEQQNAGGWGIWQEGKWLVVLTRPLATGDPHDASLKPGEKTAIAFAVWEGASGNVGARKNYAPWVPLILEK